MRVRSKAEIEMRTGLWALGCLAALSAAAAFGAERTVSVRDFGALGDGVHDDGPAIQKALDATERPLTVLIPDGVYVVGAALRVGSATTVRAASNAVVRLADDAGKDCHSFVIANRDWANGNTDISVEGGVWDGNNAHNRRGGDGNRFAYTGAIANFTRVKNLTLRKMTMRNPDAFSIRLGEVEDFLVEDIVLDHTVVRPNQDGIHLGGCSRRGVIRRIKALHPGTPNDDMIAINADDDVERCINLGMRCGPISDVTVEDIEAEGAYSFVRILSKDSLVENIAVRRVKGSCRYYAINLNRWRFPVGSGNIRHVLLEDFRVGKIDYTPWAPAHIDVGLRVQDVRIRNYVNTGPEGVVLAVNNGATNSLGTADGKVRTGASFSLPGGVIDDLRINGKSE